MATSTTTTTSTSAAAAQVVLGEGSYGCVTLVTTENGMMARKTFLHPKDWNYELEVYKSVTETVDRLGTGYRGVGNLSIPLFSSSKPKATDKDACCFLDFPPAEMDLHTLAFSQHAPKCARIDSSDKVFAIVRDALAGLAFLHDHVNLTHCDIKPDNLLLYADGHLAICDFGMAVPRRTDKPTLHIGTFGYMAPEAWRAPKEVGHTMDVFALGMALFEVFEGKLPYEPTKKLYKLNTAWAKAPNTDEYAARLKALAAAMCKFYNEQAAPSMRAENLRSATFLHPALGRLVCRMAQVAVKDRPTAQQALNYLEDVGEWIAQRPPIMVDASVGVFKWPRTRAVQTSPEAPAPAPPSQHIQEEDAAAAAGLPARICLDVACSPLHASYVDVPAAAAVIPAQLIEQDEDRDVLVFPEPSIATATMAAAAQPSEAENQDHQASTELLFNLSEDDINAALNDIELFPPADQQVNNAGPSSSVHHGDDNNPATAPIAHVSAGAVTDIGTDTGIEVASPSTTAQSRVEAAATATATATGVFATPASQAPTNSIGLGIRAAALKRKFQLSDQDIAEMRALIKRACTGQLTVDSLAVGYQTNLLTQKTQDSLLNPHQAVLFTMLSEDDRFVKMGKFNDRGLPNLRPLAASGIFRIIAKRNSNWWNRRHMNATTLCTTMIAADADL